MKQRIRDLHHYISLFLLSFPLDVFCTLSENTCFLWPGFLELENKRPHLTAPLWSTNFLGPFLDLLGVDIFLLYEQQDY